MAQTVKNLPARQETQVRTLGGEDTLEKGMATHPGIIKLRHKYFFLAFKNLQLPQKFLNLRKFSDFLHFSVDILVNLLWLPLSLKLGSTLQSWDRRVRPRLV